MNLGISVSLGIGAMAILGGYIGKALSLLGESVNITYWTRLFSTSDLSFFRHTLRSILH